MVPSDDERRAGADLVQSFRRQRQTSVVAFVVIASILVILAALSPAIGWGLPLALVASYGVTTAVGQVLLHRLELRLRGGMRAEDVEQRFRRMMTFNNLVLVGLLILLLLLFRLI